MRFRVLYDLWLFLWICMVYEALGDTLRMNFVVAFVELWLEMVSLELWLGWWMDMSIP